VEPTNPNRKKFFDAHVKCATHWEYIPMSWHKWKFLFWPSLPESHLKTDVLIDAYTYVGSKTNEFLIHTKIEEKNNNEIF